MKYLFPALCWAVLIGGFGCAKHPTIHSVTPATPHGEPFQEDKPTIDPNEVVLNFDDDADPKGPIYFDFDSFRLKEIEKVSALAQYLIHHPSKAVDLAGHCSQEGTTDYNLALGARRAQAVRGYLEAAGVPESRINWKSFGEEIPVTEDPAEYWKNRRVEFFLEDPK